MTLRLFFHSDDLKANVEVLDCTPHENEFAVVLRATLFHPQGGGQPCDTGMIGESQVLRVVQEALTKPPYNFIPVNKDVPLPDYLPMKSLDEMSSFIRHDWAKINPLRAGWIEKFNKEMAK